MLLFSLVSERSRYSSDMPVHIFARLTTDQSQAEWDAAGYMQSMRPAESLAESLSHARTMLPEMLEGAQQGLDHEPGVRLDLRFHGGNWSVLKSGQ